MTDKVVQLPNRARKGLGLATVSEAFEGSASWLDALASMLEKESGEFELDPAFVDILLHKSQFEATQVGLRRIADILRTLDADVRRQGGSP